MVQTLTKKGLKNCVSYVRNYTTTYDIHQGHSQVFQEKTDQNKRLNEHIQIVRILQAEEHQGQILFLFCIHLREIQQISSWKSISIQADESYNLLKILEEYLQIGRAHV